MKMKNYIGEILLTAGAGLFTYNLLSFSGVVECTIVIDFGDGCRAHYYAVETRILTSVGIMLIMTGLLYLKAKSKEN
jgi:hypothetical protein